MLNLSKEDIITEYFQYKEDKKDSLGNIAIPTGSDGINYKKFEENIDVITEKITENLNSKDYGFSALLSKQIPKKYGGVRIVYIYTISDYLVFKLLLKSIMIYYERKMKNNYYVLGYRKGFSTANVMTFIRTNFVNGFEIVLHIDIVDFLNNINRDTLLRILEKYFLDKETIEFYYLTKYFEFLNHKQGFENKGLPTGCVLNPLLSNIYLHTMDEYIISKLLSESVKYVRYGDDLFFSLKYEKDISGIYGNISNFLNLELDLDAHEIGNSNKSSVFYLYKNNFFVFSAYKFNNHIVQIDNHTIGWIKKDILKILQRNKNDLDAKVNSINAYILGYTNILYNNCETTYGYNTPLKKHSILFFFYYSTDIIQMRQFDKWVRKCIFDYYYVNYHQRIEKKDLNLLISVKKMYFNKRKGLI